MENEIIGLGSAYICAQETGYGNMQISARLVVDLIERLRAAEAEISRLPAKWSEDSSLESWFPYTKEELDHLRNENSKLRARIDAAEKQAVPDGWKLVPVEVDRDTALSMIIAAAKANGLSTEHTPTEQEIENSWRFANAVLAAAPSHSQQSDAVDLLRQIFELYEDGVDCYENPDEGAGYLGKAFRIDDETFKLCVALLDSSEDRCPSHESEQLQNLKAAGMAEGE